MAATIANLSVMLGVNTSGLTRGFSSASKQAQQFASGLGGGMDSGLGGLAAGVAGRSPTARQVEADRQEVERLVRNLWAAD